MGRSPVGSHDRHAALAASDDECAGDVLREDLAASRDDLLVGCALVTASALQLVQVRSQDRRSLVLEKRAALRVYEHLFSRPARRRNRTRHYGVAQHPLGIVGEHDDVGIGQRSFELRQRRGRDRRRQRSFALHVGPQDLLTRGQMPGLERGGTGGIDDHLRPQRRHFGQPRAQLTSRLIVSDHSKEYRLASQGRDVPRDIGGASGHVGGALDSHHRHRSFGRHALNRAVDEPIQHHVAEHQNSGAGERLQDSQQIGVAAHARACANPRRISSALHSMWLTSRCIS